MAEEMVNENFIMTDSVVETDKMTTSIGEKQVEEEKIQEVGDLLGKFKLWQIMYFVALVYVYGVTGWTALSMAFLTPELKFECNPEIIDGRNWTESEDHCSYKVQGDDTAHTCKSFSFNESEYKRSFTQDFSLVCGRLYLVSLSNSLHHVGDIFASLYLSYMADRFGRRPVIISAIIPGIVGCFMALFAPNIIVFLIAKMLFGMSGMSLASVGFVLLMEITGVKYRGLLGIAVEFGWVTFYVILPGIAWLLKDSFNIQLVITIAYILLLSLWWIVPESPRWLLLRGKTEKAEQIMKKACKINGLVIPDLKAKITLLSLQIQASDSSSQETKNVLHLFRLPSIRKRTLILYLYWFVNGFVYYGISLNAGIFGGNVYLNFFLFGVVEYPAYLVFTLVLSKFGRKFPLGSTMFMAGVFCCLVGFVPQDVTWAILLLTVLGKFCIASAFAIAYPYTSEAYPTQVRSIALGSCSTCARIAGILAPFANEMKSIIGLPAVMMIFGGLGIISGALVYLLPETKGVVLADTLVQGEKLGKL